MKRIGVVGATGLVGQTLCQIAAEKNISAKWLLFASSRQTGRVVPVGSQQIPVHPMDWELLCSCDLIFMLTPGEVSALWIERLVKETNIPVIDNASTYRLDPSVPLLIPEINRQDYHGQQLIANPNCVAIQLLLALAPLKDLPISSVVLTSFQSVSGSGWAGLADLERTSQSQAPQFYPHVISGNVLPQCDAFDGDWTAEERKICAETAKILAPSYPIYPTCVRVPVPYGHQLSLTLTFEEPCSKEQLLERWLSAPRIEICHQGYVLNTDLKGRDEVFISRIRAANTQGTVWQCWVGADNLRVGAATNALNIASCVSQNQHSVELA